MPHCNACDIACPQGSIREVMKRVGGKCGIGKSMITATPNRIVPNKLLSDCDVDAANPHLILPGETVEEQDFQQIRPERNGHSPDRGLLRA